MRRDQPVDPARVENKPAEPEAVAALPAFITGGVPKPSNSVTDSTEPAPLPLAPGGIGVEGEHESASYHLRNRRRRRRPGQGDEPEQTAEQPIQTDAQAEV
jgi:hypothetical protein